MNLDKLKVFYSVAQAESFSKTDLNLSASVISRHVSDLEYHLKSNLFTRSTKKVQLTPEGQKLYAICHRVFGELENLKEKIASNYDEFNGTLKITTPTGWVSMFIIKALQPFLDQNPNIHLNIRSSDHIPNFLKKETDLALLSFAPNDPDLIAIKLIDMNFALYASQKYLDEFGTPKSVEDLSNHRLVAHGEDQNHPIVDTNWHLNLGMPRGMKRQPYLTVNDLFYAGEAGYGIVPLIEKNVFLKSSPLVKILPEIQGPTISSYGIYPKGSPAIQRINRFLDFLQNQLLKDF